ncbi:hypothetical protein, partial [Eubacterium aggregans]|uniref:hypothetical protein n=1 Tax=Eubacterium aggregans TaxID=81409 RepID=UPI003F3B62D0
MTIDPVSYKITYTLNAPGQIYHRFIGGDTLYYKISVIKKGTPLTQLDDPTKKTELLKVNANTVVKAEDYTAIENFAFEEGDMLGIYSWGSTFAIPGELMIGSDGKSTVDYRNWCGNDEQSRHSVYQLTAKGIQEIYNEKPTVSGYETPLYGKYNQATWGHIDGQEEINHPYYCDMEFKDDRNMDGNYVPGGFKITKKEGKTTFGVTNTPPDNRTPSIWNTVYTVTDAWGRTGDSKTRTIVQLPNID